jgi:DNA-binding NtrC family response regulator
MKLGAFDFIEKPINPRLISLLVDRALEKQTLILQNRDLRSRLEDKFHFKNIVARSERMVKIFELIRHIAPYDSSVLIIGESGTGKELIANAIHYNSPRASMAFIKVSCASLSEGIIESELFGHEKGAFTGAVKTKQGLVEIADTGTLFLDEIAEMAPNLQAKLLKVIEEGEFYRVGGTRPVKVDVRFIAATNQNVRTVIAEGRFREDLYYRLNVMEISISPLRDRRDDIPPLCTYFLEKHLPGSRKRIAGFTKEAMDVLMHYSYPGNVRELENIIERAIILEKTDMITPDSLPQTIKMFQIETIDPDKVKTIEELNKEYAEKVVEMFGDNRSKAAEVLGISRTSLWRILKDDDKT